MVRRYSRIILRKNVFSKLFSTNSHVSKVNDMYLYLMLWYYTFFFFGKNVIFCYESKLLFIRIPFCCIWKNKIKILSAIFSTSLTCSILLQDSYAIPCPLTRVAFQTYGYSLKNVISFSLWKTYSNLVYPCLMYWTSSMWHFLLPFGLVVCVKLIFH